MRKKSRAVAVLLGSLASGLLMASTALAQTPHVVAPVAEAKWTPAPPMLPAGAQIAVLSGDPMQPGAYAIRLKFPANYTIPAHSHPTNENVTVVSGELFVGMGYVVNKAAARALGHGGFALLPAKMNHFAFTRQETTIILFGQGPVDFMYVNPADDPRNVDVARGTR